MFNFTWFVRIDAGKSGTYLNISWVHQGGKETLAWEFRAFASSVDDALYYNLVRMRSSTGR